MAAASEKRRCHYEVLGVPMDSTAEEIRSAYRKLALQLHPDKLIQSGLSQSEATAKFQELSQSYEVLSDPKERSWYDSHRSKILFTTADSASSSVVPDLFAYFSNSAFSGYSSDSKKSFFKVYSDVFNRIYANELEFARRMGGAAEDVEEAPAMGDLDSPYAQAAAFYAYWTGFSTVLDFSWAEPYDAAAGEDRKSRRVMEEENKKARRKARREYNETVRGLAEFVKKRDKRVIGMAVKKKEAEERRQAEERDRRKREEKERLERAMAYQEPEWAQVAEDDDEVVEEEEEVEEVEEIYCVACGKRFKSDEQWKNHERSKKHRENVERIRKEVVFDGEEEDEEQEPEDKNKSEDDLFVEELEEMMRDKARVEVDEEAKEVEEQQQQKDKDEIEIDNVVEDEEQEEDNKHEDEIGVLEAMLGGRRNRKKAVPLDKDDDDVMEYNDRKSTRKNRRRAKKGNNENGAKNGEEEEKDKVEEEKEKEKEKLVFEKKGINAKSEAANGSKSKASSKGKKAKGGSKNSSNNECEKCGEEFESRTKLHKHLSDTGHASLKYR